MSFASPRGLEIHDTNVTQSSLDSDAKYFDKGDLVWINKDMNWHRESRMNTLWEKPELIVRLTKNPNFT